MKDVTQTKATSLSVALVAIGVTVLGVVATFAVAPAAANHGDDAGNYTIVLPEPSDHLPGDQNPENASMQNFAQSGDLFEQAGAPNGFETLDYLETGTPEIDYSNCDSPNTAAFGIDRGNNNTGTRTDADLLEHMKESRFKENKIEVEFYEEEDFGGDPTYIDPEDAIVSVQGAGSSGGPCFTMPTEPGWYQVNGMIRGTTGDGEVVEIESKSHYFPICEGCHEEETAREELGPPPSQRDDGSDDGDGDATPTPTATATPTPTESDGSDEEATATPTATPTPTEVTDDGETDDVEESVDDADSIGNGADDEELTPTPGDGPGFGPPAALLGLLVAALLARRR